MAVGWQGCDWYCINVKTENRDGSDGRVPVPIALPANSASFVIRDGPCILWIMTQGDDFARVTVIIRNISAMVYA